MAKKKKRTGLWITLGIIIIAVVGISFFMSGKKNEAISVTTTKVSKKTITQTVSAIGKIQPETEVKISSQVSGEIIFLGVKEGDNVKKGQLLVRIKPDLIEPQLKQMRAAADASKMEISITEAEKERAESDMKRIAELYKKEFISKQEFETAKATASRAISSYQAALSRYQASLAQLGQIESERDRASIYSPIDGVITLLSVEIGEKVVGTGMMAGTELMRVSDLSVMNAVVDVDENDIILVKKGDTAYIEIDALDDVKVMGSVYEIGHSAKSSLLGTQDQVINFEVKVRLIDNEPRLRPGMSSNVDIHTETRYNVIAVPLQAVTVRDVQADRAPDVDKNNGSGPGQKTAEIKSQKYSRPPSVVFVNNNSTAKMVQVETGISDKGFIEITSGLSDSDEIISGSYLAVSKDLTDGAKITIDTLSTKKFPRK
ncbi:MAG: efflux RND transporter periplasmic adaptor subunit [Candidatus Kapabacteria bacterium]|nr:efflux RND transporter periplasmic adaptor subunit [Ignavibacteriota bacterium]MCW5884484.1 efflux RND transporter periplasmic adaptor subunit [Candidatus Kapabacteria bacterium]